jgi:hypothetical protein
MTLPAWRARWRRRSNSLGVRWMGLPRTVMEWAVRVHHEVAGLNCGRGALGGAAQVGADPGQQLLDAEGLGDVVVGAGVEGFHLGALVVADGEE